MTDVRPKMTSVEYEHFTGKVDTHARTCTLTENATGAAVVIKFENWFEVVAIFEHFGHQIPGLKRT